MCPISWIKIVNASKSVMGLPFISSNPGAAVTILLLTKLLRKSCTAKPNDLLSISLALTPACAFN